MVKDGDDDDVGLLTLDNSTKNHKIRKSQATVMKYTMPASKLLERMVENWVQVDMLLGVWDCLAAKAWGHEIDRVVKEVILGKVCEQFDNKETARDMLEDGLVEADLLVEFRSKDDADEVMPADKKSSNLNRVAERNIKKGLRFCQLHADKT